MTDPAPRGAAGRPAGGRASDPAERPATDHAARLGARLRAARQAQSMTLATLAGKAGVTKGFLSLLERGRTNVSVPLLIRICESLGIPLGSLFDAPAADVVPAGRGAPLQMGGRGLTEYILTPATQPDLQVHHTTIEPGGGSGGAYTLDAQTIFAYVVDGRLQLEVDGLARLLQTGDAATFSARSPHAWHNPSRTATAVVLWAICPPVAGSGEQPPTPVDGADHSPDRPRQTRHGPRG